MNQSPRPGTLRPPDAGFAAPVGPRSRGPLWTSLGVIVALAVVVLVVMLARTDSGGAGDSDGPGPREVVVAFMAAAETGNAEEAKKYVCEKLQPEITDDGPMPSEMSYEVGTETIDGDSAKVPVELTIYYESKVTETMIFVLTRAEGTWKICDYAIE
ncbi:hypothetical protein EK0264_02800 [Epidermidibacterium keratini]|uniref:DUF4878 domain-containing protein n=1 Tax=Epidermidibacterium keratini TaxID=1891644 RepID=A0A7L4YJ29_9ACTN|nr:hypothetical protein [Epidermidibacterium keratini]QHB99320.1 hypothetical protein EK0264_02800 [Epidermidibacterium keratini]